MVAATSPLPAVVPLLPVPTLVVPPPPPAKNGYQRMPDRLPVDPVVDEVVVRGVGVGPPIGASSSGRLIAVSGFKRSVGSPLAGTSSVSASPCAIFIRLARAGVHACAPLVPRHVKS